MGKTITIVYTDGFSKRNIETSALISNFKKNDFQVNIAEKPFRKVDLLHAVLWRFKIVLYDILKYRFLEIKNIKKQILKHKYESQGNLVGQDKLKKYLGFPFPKSKIIFNILNKLFIRLPSCIHYFKTDIILITNMQDYIAQSYIKYAEKNKLIVLPLLNSWDHLTHGGQVIKSDSIPFYMVWNDIHKSELMRLHCLEKDKIRIVGALQYEYLFTIEKDKNFKKEKLINFYGIEKDYTIIFLPAYNSRHGKNEPYILEELLKNSTKLEKKIAIIIRPYPGDSTFESRFCRVIKRKNVFISNVDKDFLIDRGNIALLLKFSDVVLSGCGTAAIEAMYYNTPVVHIAIDPTRGVGLNTLEKENFFSDHYCHIMEKKASFFVQTTEELIGAIITYANFPEFHASERRALVDEQLCFKSKPPSEIVVNLAKGIV